jgi:hypothetical protein
MDSRERRERGSWRYENQIIASNCRPGRSRSRAQADERGVTGEKGASFFKQSFELKIKGDLIPEAAAEEIIGELQALFARHNAGAALSAKAIFKPTKEFHTVRHTLYSAEENMEVDKVVAVAASVKTKRGIF